MEQIFQWIDRISDLFSILASALAIFLFITQRRKLSVIFNILMNYSYQLSLSELKEKIERLNDLNGDDNIDKPKIIFIMNEMMGQIKGNDKLSKHFTNLLIEINKFNRPQNYLTEARKRAFVSELRERLRHLNIQSIDNLVGG